MHVVHRAFVAAHGRGVSGFSATRMTPGAWRRGWTAVLAAQAGGAAQCAAVGGMRRQASTIAGLSELFMAVKQEQLTNWKKYSWGIQTVAQTLRDSNELLDDKWKLEDLTLALALLPRIRTGHNTVTVPDHYEPLTDTHRLHELRLFLGLAHASYSKDDHTLLQRTHLRPQDLIVARFSNDVLLPAHFVAVCHRSKAVVLTVRGTWELSDSVASAIAAPEAFSGGLAHRGVVWAARELLPHVREPVLNAMRANPTYRLVIAGHSLGAGVATILGIMLQDEGIPAYVYGYSCPPCLDWNLANRSKSLMTTVVHGHDLVPRLHLTAIEKLRRELAAVDWAQELQALAIDEFKRSPVGVATSKLLQTRETLFSEAGSVVHDLEERIEVLQRLRAIAADIDHGAITESAGTKFTATLQTLAKLDAEYMQHKLARIGNSPQLEAAEQMVAQIQRDVRDTSTQIAQALETKGGSWFKQLKAVLSPDKRAPELQAKPVASPVLRETVGQTQATNIAAAEASASRSVSSWLEDLETLKTQMLTPFVGAPPPIEIIGGQKAAGLQFFLPGQVLFLHSYSKDKADASAPPSPGIKVAPVAVESKAAGGSGVAEEPASGKPHTRHAICVQVPDPAVFFSSIVLSTKMVTDHMCRYIEGSLDSYIAQVHQQEAQTMPQRPASRW